MVVYLLLGVLKSLHISCLFTGHSIVIFWVFSNSVLTGLWNAYEWRISCHTFM